MSAECATERVRKPDWRRMTHEQDLDLLAVIKRFGRSESCLSCQANMRATFVIERTVLGAGRLVQQPDGRRYVEIADGRSAR